MKLQKKLFFTQYKMLWWSWTVLYFQLNVGTFLSTAVLLKEIFYKKMQFLVTPTEFAIARYFLIHLVVFQMNFGLALLPSKTRLAKLDIRSRFVCGFVMADSLNWHENRKCNECDHTLFYLKYLNA